jgi:2'-5' RNA ligase
VAKERLKSPRLRLFVALDLPEPFLDELVAWREHRFGGLAEARLLPRASLHVTLVFLGYQYERDVERIAEICFREAAGPFELRATEATGVPPRRPRLYALGLEDEAGAVGAWQGELSTRLTAAGLYEPEKRPFWSHLTVARVRHGWSAPRGRLPELPERVLRAEGLVLFRSWLGGGPARYEPLVRAAFG